MGQGYIGTLPGYGDGAYVLTASGLYVRSDQSPTFELIAGDDTPTASRAAGSKSPTVSTRASSATYLVSGVLLSKGNNLFRWDDRGLWREPTAKTNLILHSDDLTQSPTWIATNGSIIADQITGPDGSTLCEHFHEDTTTGSHFASQSVSLTSGTVYTASVYLYPVNRDWVIVELDNRGIYYHLSGAGTVGNTYGGAVGRIERLGSSNWYRCMTTITAGTTGARLNRIYATTGNGVASHTGTDVDSIGVCGAQIEAGSDAATSYIPTAGSTATRVAERLYYEAADNVPQDMAKVTATIQVPDALDDDAYVVSVNDGGSSGDRIELFVGESDGLIKVQVEEAVGGLTVDAQGSTDLRDGQPHAIELTYKANEVLVSVDGSQEISDTSATIPDDLDRLAVGESYDGSGGNIWIKQLQVWEHSDAT